MRLLDLILILISAAATIGIIVILRELAGAGRNTRKKSEIGIVVRGGIDVDSIRPGERKGDYFNAGPDHSGTIVIGGEAQSLWKITLTDLASGEKMESLIHRSLIIGRNPSEGAATESLVLGGDPLVSRNHCMIYANGSGLSVRDMGAKNPVTVNGRDAGQGIPLGNGDILVIGSRQYKATFRMQ